MNLIHRYFKIKTVFTTLVIFIFIMLFVEIFKYQQIHSGYKTNIDDEFVMNDYASINVPGDFLKNYQIINEKNYSYCNFNYGLPYKFDYNKDDMLPSPELGAGSPYRVLYHVINATIHNIPQLTYCTHATPEFLFQFSEIVRFWDGPISLTVFVPNSDAQIAISYLKQICDCLPQMYKVSVHFIFPANMLAYKYRQLKQQTNECIVPASYNKIVTYRNKKSLEYPVNVARNAARLGAKTKFVLVSDVELIPSEGLAYKFMNMLKRIQLKHDGKISARFDTEDSTDYLRYVFVVPVFEVELSEKVPRTKLTLQQMYANNKAIYFHRWICMHCQRFPGLQKWLSKSSNPDLIKPLVVVKREFPYHRWEPIFIGTNRDPLYSETLCWEGLQDKMTQMLEMCFLKYRFVILDNAFLVHIPGIKRRTNNSMWRRPYQRQNAKAYTTVLRQLATKYEKNQRCRLQ